jgi:hypothetical protein
MYGKVSKVDEAKKQVTIEGYIRQNFLNSKRLIHITGRLPMAFKISKIELGRDPCPLKISNKEKEQVLATSKA